MAEEGKSSGNSGVRVCVTGGAGFIGSWLVKKLLERGYTVHATLRNTGAGARFTVAHFDSRREIGQKRKERRLIADQYFVKYIMSKLRSERELLSYNDGESPAYEVVTLPLGLVAGDTVLGRAPETLENAVSPVSRNELYFGFPRLLQRLLGSVPLVHVDDVCDALVFCMERPSIAGRFLCAAAYPTTHDVVDHYAKKFPHLDILKE